MLLPKTKPFEVVENRNITPNVRHLALKITDGEFHFIPGQFITIHFEKEGHALKRSYSIASIPGQDQTIDFAASYVQGGPGSEYLFALKPGDITQVSGPFGRLILKDEPFQRVLLIATGTGVTPYRAMLPSLSQKLALNPQLKVIIMQGVQHRQDVLYAEDFLAWAKQHPRQAEFRSYLSRENLSQAQAAHEFKGYVQSSFADLNIDAAQDVVYLCGNPNMIDQAFTDLQSRGMPSTQVRREKYISSK